MSDNAFQKIEKKQTSFRGDVMRLMSGTVFSQIITISTMPIISRLFCPDAFGILALFSAITGVLGSVACWRYELAIVLPENDEDAVSLLWLSLFATACTTFCVSMLVVFFAEPILIKLNALILLPYRWLIPVFVVIQGTYTALTYWNTRTKRFTCLSTASILNSVMTRFFNVISGLNNFIGGGAMIFAMLFGQSIATLTHIVNVIRHDGSFIKQWLNYSNLVINFKRYKKFPIFSVPEAFLNTLSLQLPAILLSFYFDSAVVGFFSFGHRLLAMPMALVGSAIGQVFFRRGAMAKNSGNLPEVVENIFRRLVTIGFYPFILLMIVAPELFGFAFGKKWVEAGNYLRVLAPWMAVNFVTSPLSTLISILNRQEFGMYFNVILVICRSSSLIIGGIKNDVNLTLILLSTSGVFAYVFFSLYIFGYAGVRKTKILTILFTHSLVCCLFAVPVLIVRFYFCSFEMTMLASCLMISLYFIKFRSLLIE